MGEPGLQGPGSSTIWGSRQRNRGSLSSQAVTVPVPTPISAPAGTSLGKWWPRCTLDAPTRVASVKTSGAAVGEKGASAVAAANDDAVGPDGNDAAAVRIP